MDATQNKVKTPFASTGELTQKSKLQFTQLMDADLKFETGKEQDVLIRMESCLNKSYEDLIALFNKIQQAKTEVR